MNKIIIDPHYCTAEEYQELKDYLTDKTWDWQEISSGESEEKEVGKTIEVLQHTIAYSYSEGDVKKAVNIEWETDDDENPDLPNEVCIPEGKDDVSSYLSDEYGWLVESFTIEDLKPDECDIEHIEKMISEGYSCGELNTGKDEKRGWWHILVTI